MDAQTVTAEPTVINGINVDNLFDLIQGIRQDAAKGKTNWRVKTTWQGQARSRAQVEDFWIGGERVPRPFSIDIDEPSELRQEPVCQSARTSARGAQCLHDSGLRCTVCGARNHSR